ncbi:MAG: Grx4 family monothiol glutaredoxin [Chlamydiia bacterium]|nr:Grx4 family monothiol glutaredoxin [Chlamydiia bacterium]
MTDIQEKIKQEIENNKIILFMKGSKLMPHCGFSARVVDILNKLDVKFETRDVLQDDALREGIKTFSNWPTLPQLYISGKFIGGCDIVTQLFEQGELKTLVEEA